MSASQAATEGQFKRPLSLGSRGADVLSLQTILNSDPATRVASFGPGSSGSETIFFGPATKQAVLRFQEKYRDDILVPNKLMHGTGYVGSSTIARLLRSGTATDVGVAPTVPAILLGCFPGSLFNTLTGIRCSSAATTTAVVYGGSGGGGGAVVSTPSVPATPDTTPPVISSISSGSPGQTSVTITWSTDENSDSQVNYGVTSSYSASTTLDSTQTTSHSVLISGLSAASTYHFRVRSADSSGNLSLSSDQTFSTTDTTAPTVSMTVPANAATVSGSTVTLSANASDNIAVAGVTFKVGGVIIGSEDTSSPYSVTWNTTATSSGAKAILAVARDTANNLATSSSISVTVDNVAPLISAIATGTPAQTAATITWTTDELASSTISYGLTSGYGIASSSPALATSHSVTLTGLAASSVYHFQITSADAQGNSATSSDQTFTTSAPLAGSLMSLAINTTGWTADVTLNGLTTGGTYSLTPNSTPKLTFSVTSSGYDSSGNATTTSRTVYGTVPLRQAYPNGTANTESVSGGNLTTTVALSDDILPTDTVTATALAGWYTQSTSSQAITGLTPTNNSTASSYRPIGAWITPTNIPRAAGAGMRTEFFVASRYPRNNGQVASVVFTADDGAGHTATQSTSTMTQSTYLLSTGCTATSGSAVLTGCTNTRGMFSGQYVTLSTGSASGVGIGEPKINSVDSSSQVTLNTTATASGSVILTLGNPVYIYAATFTDTQLNTLNSGVATIRAVAYPYIGTTTLDTAAGADGVAIAASTVTPNLKNLQFYNDKSSNYSGVYAWVSTTTGASAAVQTSATDPGSTAYYGSIKAATAAIKTYMNANKAHNDACGGYIYLKPVTVTGTGGSVSSDVPSNCATNLIVDCDPAATSGACVIDAGTSSNRDLGYTTLVRNIKFTDNSTNKIVLTGPDGSSATARQAHVIFQNDWIVETQSSALAYFNQIGWRQYYNSLIDQSLGDGKILNIFGVTGITNDQFGVTALGLSSLATNAGASLYNSLGNVYSNTALAGVGNASANYIQTTSAVSAFDKILNISASPAFKSTSDGTTHNNWAIVQDVVEAVGTTNTQTAFTFSADSDTSDLSNWLRQYTSVVGNRTNSIYESKGTTALIKTGAGLFNLDYHFNRKGDYFTADGGASGNRIGSWRFRFGVGAIGNVSGPSDAGDTDVGYQSWLGDFFGLTGATSTPNVNQTSYTFQAANQNSSAGGNNTGFGYYKPNITTGLTNRVPSGFAGFPGDIEGTPRKNDGTGCAGAYECQ